MITQKMIDDYNYMIKASEGIILIKPFEKIQDKNTYNNNYRDLNDILNDVDKIFDTCQHIGIGVNPRTYEVYNQKCLSYNHLIQILNKINENFPNINILLSCSIEEINENYLQLLKKYNIKIILHIDNLVNYILKYNEIIAKETSLIECILTPYIINTEILKQYNCKTIYFYNFIKENFENIINLNKNIALNNKHFNYYENINCTSNPVILSFNNFIMNFLIGDKIVAINDIPVLCIEDFYELIEEQNEQLYKFSIIRNNYLFNFFITINQEKFLQSINFSKMLKKQSFCEIIEHINYLNEKMIMINKNDNAITLKEQLFILNKQIKIINYDNKLSFNVISLLLQKYREQNPQEIITALLIPNELFDLNEEEKTIEEFQMENLILLLFV